AGPPPARSARGGALPLPDPVTTGSRPAAPARAGLPNHDQTGELRDPGAGAARPGLPFPGTARVAYGDRVKGAHGPLGIRLVDVGLAAVVLIAVELSVATGRGPGAARPTPLAYVLGGITVLPVLVRPRWPRFELIACSLLLLAYSSSGHRRNISPAPLLSLPLYDAAVAGYLRLAIVIPALYMLV